MKPSQSICSCGLRGADSGGLQLRAPFSLLLGQLSGVKGVGVKLELA